MAWLTMSHLLDKTSNYAKSMHKRNTLVKLSETLHENMHVNLFLNEIRKSALEKSHHVGTPLHSLPSFASLIYLAPSSLITITVSSLPYLPSSLICVWVNSFRTSFLRQACSTNAEKWPRHTVTVMYGDSVICRSRKVWLYAIKTWLLFLYKLHYVLSLREVSTKGLTRVSFSTFSFDSVLQNDN